MLLNPVFYQSMSWRPTTAYSDVEMKNAARFAPGGIRVRHRRQAGGAQVD
jgi:hypothetical protein